MPHNQIKVENFSYICYSISCQVSGLPIAGCLVMLIVDTLLYGIIAAWLDNIIPTEYELKYYMKY